MIRAPQSPMVLSRLATVLAGLALAAAGCLSAKRDGGGGGPRMPAPPVVPPSPPLAGQPPEEGPRVDLESSFRIPEEGGRDVSHTPGVVFSSDGTRMVTVTSSGEVVVFETATRKILQRFQLPEEGTDAVSLDAGGRRVAWVLKRGGVAVLDVASGKQIARDEKLAARRVALSPDGNRLAAAGAGLEVRDAGSLELLESVPGHQSEVTNLAWSADGRLLGSTAQDGRLLVFDLAAKAKRYETMRPSPLHAVAFHPRGTRVAYGGQENKVYQYDLEAGREDVVSKQQPFWITCLGYSPDGRKLAVGDESCDIWLYDLGANEMVFHNKHHVECWLGDVAWAPDNETFLFACRPNSHAGKPALYEVLARAEAARSAEVRRSRDVLGRALAARLVEEKDPEARKALESYQLALAGEEKVEEGPWVSGVSGGTGFAVAQLMLEPQDAVEVSISALQEGPISFTAEPDQLVQSASFSLGLGPAPPALDKLPPEIQKLAKEHQQALEQEIAKLKSSFSVNPWKYKAK
ncbi:MAG: hypothetical protein HY721_28815 [Planctomycetes bacterium]|nr:hypothetical protein [Planctomycetota bacterium]